jgi:acid phosphatase type 7
MDEARSRRRDAVLLIVAFAGTLILLAGLAFALASRPPSDGIASSGEPSAGSTPEPGSSTQPSAPVSSGDGSLPPATPSGPPSTSPDDPVFVGAGDIADCNTDADEATAALLDNIAGTVFTTGDNAYPEGRLRDFEECYEPTWGRHKDRTRPVPGNHDHRTDGLEGYLEYFGDAAVNSDGDPWYSYDLGAWHIIALDSECEDSETCGEGDQADWLAADLAANDAFCTMAIWHVPRYSSGFHQNDNDIEPFWAVLYEADVDVIVNGHDHDYERFAPMNPDGDEDRDRGMRQFVIGTGGTTLRPFEELAPNSELRAAVSHGVLKFTLHDRTYDWEFVPTSGSFSDRGSAACH